MTSKDEIRLEAKRARSLLRLELNQYQKITDFFFDSICTQDNTIIASYMPRGREIDTHYIMDECLNRGIKVALPIVDKDSRLLKFVNWDHATEFVEGAYSILEPKYEQNMAHLEPDVFIVPLLAFDRRGYRLGYGGGYYDTTLSYFRDKKEITSIGLGYAAQACLFNLPTEEHDQKLDFVITESSVHKF